jgi:hypothetical protein
MPESPQPRCSWHRRSFACTSTLGGAVPTLARPHALNFLKLLDTARTLWVVRENTHYDLTRTLLELGRQLITVGVFDRPEMVFHLQFAELERVGELWPPSLAYILLFAYKFVVDKAFVFLSSSDYSFEVVQSNLISLLVFIAPYRFLYAVQPLKQPISAAKFCYPRAPVERSLGRLIF